MFKFYEIIIYLLGDFVKKRKTTQNPPHFMAEFQPQNE